VPDDILQLVSLRDRLADHHAPKLPARPLSYARDQSARA
jgi:hypothetical protein